MRSTRPARRENRNGGPRVSTPATPEHFALLVMLRERAFAASGARPSQAAVAARALLVGLRTLAGAADN